MGVETRSSYETTTEDLALTITNLGSPVAISEDVLFLNPPLDNLLQPISVVNHSCRRKTR